MQQPVKHQDYGKLWIKQKDYGNAPVSPTIAKVTNNCKGHPTKLFVTNKHICYLSTLRIVWFLFVDDPQPPNGRFLKKGPGYIRYITRKYMHAETLADKTIVFSER
jgi:hypothetical protein